MKNIVQTFQEYCLEALAPPTWGGCVPPEPPRPPILAQTLWTLRLSTPLLASSVPSVGEVLLIRANVGELLLLEHAMHNVVHAVAFSYHSSMYVQYVLTFICFSNMCTNISPTHKSSGLSQLPAATPIVQSVQGPWLAVTMGSRRCERCVDVQSAHGPPYIVRTPHPGITDCREHMTA